MRLWWKITTATEAQAGPLLAARLEGRPFEIAMNLKTERVEPDGTVRILEGENVLELPSTGESALASGEIIPKQNSGLGLLIDALKRRTWCTNKIIKVNCSMRSLITDAVDKTSPTI